MSSGKTVTLTSGSKIPQLGYGTWKSKPGEVFVGVFEALRAGYRHLDLAIIYENQLEVGRALKKALEEIPGLKREDIFITSKLWNNKHRSDEVEPALDQCLEELGLDYLDLYLIHWPVVFGKGDEFYPLNKKSSAPQGDILIDDDVSIIETWKAMIKLPKSKARAVGVSNFSTDHLKIIIDATGVVPVVNQIERHPRLQQTEGLVRYMQEKSIHLIAYSAFGNNEFGKPLLITHPEVKKVAEKNGCTPAQAILAWSQVGGHSVIPKSVTPSRIVQNFQEVTLSDEDITTISALGSDPERFNVPYISNTPRWDINIFNDPNEVDATHKVILGA